MKVLLIKTAEVFHETEETQAVPPGGLGYIASSLQKNKFDVEIIDVLAEGFDNKKYLDEEWFRVGLDNDKLKERIAKSNPNFVGISSEFTSQHEMLVETVKDVKSIIDVPVVVGGIHATFMPDEIFKIEGVDYVLKGEAEETMPTLLKADKKNLDKISGLSFLRGGKVIHNEITSYPDINKLPYPARKLYPSASRNGDLYSKLNAPHGHKFNTNNLPYYELITSRGCNYKCAGCAGSKFARNNRVRSVDDVVKEIDLLANNFGMKSLTIIDDNFIQNKDRAEKILNEIIGKKYNLNLTFPNGLLIRNLFKDGEVDKKFLDLLVEAGTTEIDLPIETASPRILREYLSDKYNPNLNLNELCKTFADKNIKVAGYFMLGFPNESKEEMDSTINLARQLKGVGMDTGWFFAVTAFPGTQYWDNMKDYPTVDKFRELRFRRALKFDENTEMLELNKIREDAQRELSIPDFKELKRIK